MKRIISFLMVLVLCVSLMATAAYAEDLKKATGTITVKPQIKKGTVEVYRLFDNTEEKEVLAWRADESGKDFTNGFAPKDTKMGAYYPFFCDAEENNGVVRIVEEDKLAGALNYIEVRFGTSSADSLAKRLVKFIDKHEIEADLTEEVAATVVFEELEYNYYLVVIRDEKGEAVLAVLVDLNEKNNNVVIGEYDNTVIDNGNNDNGDNGDNGDNDDNDDGDNDNDNTGFNALIIHVDKRIGKDKVEIGFGKADQIVDKNGWHTAIAIPVPPFFK